MSFYSLGKNEVAALINMEKKINDELKMIRQGAQNVLNIREVVLLRKLEKIQAKLKVLKSESDPDDIA
jgi:hypothetical protein